MQQNTITFGSFILKKIQNVLSLFAELRRYLGGEVCGYLIRAFWAGLFWFVLDGIFVYILQGFFVAIGVITREETFLPKWYPENVNITSLLLILFAAARGYALFLKTYLPSLTNQSFIRRQRSRILEFSLLGRHEFNIQEINSIYSNLVGSSGEVLSQITQILILCTTMLFLILFAYQIAPYQFLISVGILIIFLFPLKYLNLKVEKKSKTWLQDWDTANYSLLYGVKNNYLLRVIGALSDLYKNGNDALESYERKIKEAKFYFAFRKSIPSTLGILIVSMITYFGNYPAPQSGVRFLSFIYIFVRFAEGGSDFFSLLSDIKFKLPALNGLLKWEKNIVQYEIEISEKKSSKIQHIECHNYQLQENGISMKFDKVGFYYQKYQWLFRNLNIDIKAGELITVKGPSGIGKSTFAGIVMGVLQPIEGTIFINETTMENMKEKIPRLIAYSATEPYLIPGTLSEILSYGLNQRLSFNDMQEALIKVGLEKIIPKDSVHYIDTPFEVNHLSLGQQQKISLARALLRKPKLLILDEATSNLDEQSESNFVKCIQKLMPEMTTFVITHRSGFDKIANHELILSNLLS